VLLNGLHSVISQKMILLKELLLKGCYYSLWRYMNTYFIYIILWCMLHKWCQLIQCFLDTKISCVTSYLSPTGMDNVKFFQFRSSSSDFYINISYLIHLK
jgi:hypothetical protein